MRLNTVCIAGLRPTIASGELIGWLLAAELAGCDRDSASGARFAASMALARSNGLAR